MSNYGILVSNRTKGCKDGETLYLEHGTIVQAMRLGSRNGQPVVEQARVVNGRLLDQLDQEITIHTLASRVRKIHTKIHNYVSFKRPNCMRFRSMKQAFRYDAIIRHYTDLSLDGNLEVEYDVSPEDMIAKSCTKRYRSIDQKDLRDQLRHFRIPFTKCPVSGEFKSTFGEWGKTEAAIRRLSA